MLTKILVVYSTVVTTLLAAFTLAGSATARGQDRPQQFSELDVHRINVREPDAPYGWSFQTMHACLA